MQSLLLLLSAGLLSIMLQSAPATATLVFYGLRSVVHAADIPPSDVVVFNNCSASIDPAFYPAADGGIGGFVLGSGSTENVTLSAGWSGRIWGRTGCDDAGVCATGDCGGVVNCTSISYTGPTIAQFTIDGYADLDFFAPSSQDGFNIAVAIIPGSGCATPTVACTDADGGGNGCDDIYTCAYGTSYTVQFC
ncbi:Osmotin, thaumatin-like protein [Fistulina hepatica ATCC 64428]|uniref:Osmotin, thaumatin-like protein n=1 Tax=Fistulina hepatica ATCC 64428 TaxID=1128425 RepID=A0A0D7AQT1_9AGAR|nr:Osmotin, thaumatin-like protein [Fistulina hepatica ATCC 64428]